MYTIPQFAQQRDSLFLYFSAQATFGGNSFGARCVFPFIFQGQPDYIIHINKI